MSGIAHRAAIISFARLCNQGIALLSPIILVRLLPVAEFGAYRRFYLYFTLVSVLATASINSSLPYFLPRQPNATWTLVRRCAGLVAMTSTLTATLVFAADRLSGGHVIGANVNHVLIYMVLFVNVDFWESLALARKRPLTVLGYSVGRLVARMTTVIVTAALTRDADAIISALVWVEAVRVTLSTISWRWMADEKSERAEPASAREILKYALPMALSMLMLIANKETGGVVVDRLVGHEGLAYLTVGSYVSMIVATLRNSVSDVLLPEMSRAGTLAGGEAIGLWQRSVIVFAMMLLPIAVLLGLFAPTVIGTVFSSAYLPAVPVFQVYLLVLVRECVDFDLAFRAAGQTRKALAGHAMTLVANISLSLVLVPAIGVVGAAVSLVVSRFVGTVYLSRRLAALAGISVRALFPFRDLFRVVAALAIAAITLLPAVIQREHGWFVIIPCSVVFAGAFVLLLRAFKVSEARWISGLIGRRLGLQHS